MGLYEFQIDYRIERSKCRELNEDGGFILYLILIRRDGIVIVHERMPQLLAVSLDLKIVGLLIFLWSKGKVFQMG